MTSTTCTYCTKAHPATHRVDTANGIEYVCVNAYRYILDCQLIDTMAKRNKNLLEY